MLPLTSGLPSQSVQFVSYCLAAGFSSGSKGKPLADPQTQLALIQWANGQPDFLKPGKEVQKLIVAQIRTWDTNFKNLLEAESDAFYPPLKSIIKDALGKLAMTQLPVGTSTPLGSVPDERMTVRDTDEVFDVFSEIERVMKHIKKMCVELDDSKKEVRKLNQKIGQIEEALRKNQQQKEEANQRSSLSEEQLKESQALTQKLELLNADYYTQIEGLRSQLADADSRHNETVKSYEEHAETLSRRIAQEGDNRIKTFCNKLAAMLRPFATDLKESQTMVMNVELGTAMRTQLKQVLKILKSQGIGIEGNGV
jgi:hypothetical protein